MTVRQYVATAGFAQAGRTHRVFGPVLFRFVSLVRAAAATSWSPSRRVLVLVAVVTAMLLGAVCAEQLTTESAFASSSRTVVPPVEEGPCAPQELCPEHAARLTALAPAGANTPADTALPSPAATPVRLGSARPREVVKAVATSRVLADLCVWRT